MRHYINPSTEVQTMKGLNVLMSSPEPTTGGGGDQGSAQAPVRKPF